MDSAPRATAMVWLIDREEVGSFHPAGATSRMLELVFAYLLRAQASPATEAVMGRAFDRSLCISADTPAGLNPNWPEVQDERNAPVLGKGPALFPYTGHGGKQGGSAASAEFIRQVAASFDRAGVPLQYGLLGRVDEGGGGTVAKYLAERGMSVVDIGVAAVSLHSPLELTAKDDLWAAYLGFRAWLAKP
jgi:aspartyl aminopeptidase